MEFDVNNEIGKLNKIVNNKKILPFENYEPDCSFSKPCTKVNYLLYVLELTYEHPEIEMYLKQLLENFSIAELNNFHNDNYTILHYMVAKLSNISLNSFEIIINFGISVNSRTKYNSTPLHFVYRHYKFLECERNVIGLFVKYGANLNILNITNRTVLDKITINKFNEHLKIIAMTLIDFGARTNNPNEHNDGALEFIESYRSSNIKPAIKK